MLPAYQGQGIGSRILADLVERCRSHGIYDIQLFCAKGKAGFYEKYGFESRPDDMLVMNPNDNQGVRALVIDCNFSLDRPSDVLAVCDQYPDDGLEQVMYGRALALYQLGRRAEAEKALSEAVEFLPLVAKELVKSRHRKPKGLRPDRVTVGGADQAYWYWIDQGQYWRNTPGAIEFVRECLEVIG